jgi:hypothetical protein
VDPDYLDHHLPLAIGRLMGNLWTLEWMLRNVLYRLGYPPHTEMPRPRPLFAANVGDRFPENALTSYHSLGKLIAAYNQTAPTPVDASLVTLRDTLAHGRPLCADESWVNMSLARFSRPVAGEVTMDTRYELTLDWLNDQIELVGAALDSVQVRYHELGGV